MQDLFGNEMIYVKVLRKGEKNTSILLPDGSKVKIPTSALDNWTLTESEQTRQKSTASRRRETRGYTTNVFGSDHPTDGVNYLYPEYCEFEGTQVPFV